MGIDAGYNARVSKVIGSVNPDPKKEPRGESASSLRAGEPSGPEAAGHSASAVRQAHGPEPSRGAEFRIGVKPPSRFSRLSPLAPSKIPRSFHGIPCARSRPGLLPSAGVPDMWTSRGRDGTSRGRCGFSGFSRMAGWWLTHRWLLHSDRREFLRAGGQSLNRRNLGRATRIWFRLRRDLGRCRNPGRCLPNYPCTPLDPNLSRCRTLGEKFEFSPALAMTDGPRLDAGVLRQGGAPHGREGWSAASARASHVLDSRRGAA